MMKPPFVVILDDRSIRLYESRLTDLEPPDVDYCFAFDSDGKVLNLEIEPVEYERRFLGWKSPSTYEGVVMMEKLPIHEDVASLRRALVRYLNEYHKIVENELLNVSTSQLIENVKEKNQRSNDGRIS